MRAWSLLRVLMLSLVIASPMLAQSGCSGGGTDQPAAGGPAEEDATLNPDEDSTMTDE